MAAYILKTDKQFIYSYGNPADQMTVWEYVAGDVDSPQFIRTTAAVHHWRSEASIHPASKQYNALQVFGVTIEGDRLVELARELRKGSKYEIGVNRLGLCVITQIGGSIIEPIRLHDYFGWSRYGVRVPREEVVSASAMWNSLDMSSGETVVDFRGIVGAAGEAAGLRRRLEEKNESYEEAVMELTVCKKELEWKEEKLKMLESQLLTIKAALRKAKASIG